MSDEILYEERVTSYTLEQLEEVAGCIDKEKYPDRYRLVIGEIARKRLQMQAAQETGSTEDTSELAQKYEPIYFEFTGKTGEYFKIWIVNICLTILTVGVFSAWAKVRKYRYIYGNTWLQNASFDYLADPIKILKGRLIVALLFAVLIVVTNYFPWAVFVTWPLYAVLFPWVVVKALAFKTRNSSYRNIRFQFDASYSQAMGVFIGIGAFVLITGGLAYPYFVYRRNMFVMNHSGYGRKRFGFSASVSNFYSIYLAAGALLFIGGCTVSMMSGLFAQMGNTSRSPGEMDVGGAAVSMAISLLTVIAVYLPLTALIKTGITNLVWNNASFGDNRFASTLKTSQMFWLYLTNGFAIVLSLGMLIPWASIRMTRYRLENLKLLSAEGLDNIVAGEQGGVGAAGEEIGDFFFDFDVGI